MKENGDIVQFLRKKDYIMVKKDLGFGAFGKTVILKDPFIDELFVAKKYEPYFENTPKEFYDSFLQEIKIMHKLNHRNVVRIYNYYECFLLGKHTVERVCSGLSPLRRDRLWC